MNLKRLKWMTVFLILMVLLTGCKNKENAGSEDSAYGMDGSDAFTDALGQEIRIRNPQRVVALMGSFADTWLNAGGKLCGVTDDAWEDGLPLPDDVVSVGLYNSPSLETIIGLSPDLVILSSETKEHAALKEALKQAHIKTAYFRVTYFDDYLSMLRICTDITGREDLYKKNGLDVKKQIEDIISAHKQKNSPRILFLITYSGGAIAKNSECMTGKMLKDLGCVNIADENESLLKEFTMESIIKEDPDYIFVVPMGNDEELASKNLKESIEKNPAWRGLTAVKNHRYILLPKELFLYKPNEKWGESYAYLSKILDGSQ